MVPGVSGATVAQHDRLQRHVRDGLGQFERGVGKGRELAGKAKEAVRKVTGDKKDAGEKVKDAFKK